MEALYLTTSPTSLHPTFISHTPCMSHLRRITVTASFLLLRVSLYSLADTGFDSFEPFVHLMHRMHSFLGSCIGIITTLGFGLWSMA